MNDGQHPYDPEQSVDFMTQQQMYDQMLQQQQQQGGARPNSIDLKRQYPPGYQGNYLLFFFCLGAYDRKLLI